LRGRSTFQSFDKTKEADVEWGVRQNELNENMLQAGKAFWPTIQLVAGKKIRVGAVPFQRRVVIQLEKHVKLTAKDFNGVSKEINDKASILTLELDEWRIFLEHVSMVKEFIKVAENAGNLDAVPHFLKTRCGEMNLYDWGKFGKNSEANIVKYRLGNKQVIMLFVWSDREGAKAPSCTLGLGRGFICKNTGKLLARGNQTVYLSGAGLDYLFSQKLNVIENGVRAWGDMLKCSLKLIRSCHADYDPLSVEAGLLKPTPCTHQIPVQEEGLFDELDNE
jgi:hypothetical protein